MFVCVTEKYVLAFLFWRLLSNSVSSGDWRVVTLPSNTNQKKSKKGDFQRLKNEICRIFGISSINKKCLNVRQKLGTKNVMSHSHTLSFNHSRHAEQLLFSCVSLKVIVCHAVTCHTSHVLCQVLMLILGTWWTTFVFMSMLKVTIYSDFAMLLGLPCRPISPKSSCPWEWRRCKTA